MSTPRRALGGGRPAADLAVAPVRRDVLRNSSRLIALKCKTEGGLRPPSRSRLQVNAALGRRTKRQRQGKPDFGSYAFTPPP